jgi:hypothetical protein
MPFEGPVGEAASLGLLDAVNHATGDRQTKRANAESEQDVLPRSRLDGIDGH